MPAPPSTPPITCQNGSLTDDNAQSILTMWQVLPGANLLINPSDGEGAGVITHLMGGPDLKINGLKSKSALANYALYSFECAEQASSPGNFTLLNLYEVMIPDIPGEKGNESTSEFYVRRLWELGLHVSGVHFHWWGSTVFDNDHLVAAVHHQSTTLSLEDFSNRTIQALNEVMALLEEKATLYDFDANE